MDNPADALLALSNTAAAIADAIPTIPTVPDDDDRSSSLSELDDAEPMDSDADGDADSSETDSDHEQDEQDGATPTPVRHDLQTDLPPATPGDDSEAETERIDDSPDKIKRTFQISPSKLAQSMNASDDVRPEIEELTNSDVSSPISPIGDSPLDELSDMESSNPLDLLSQAAATTNKRKRLSDVMDMAIDQRPTKRRSESLSDPEEELGEIESDAESVDKVELNGTTSKPQLSDNLVTAQEVLTAEPDPVQVADDKEDKDESSDTSKSRKAEQYTRSRSRRGKGLEEQDPEPDEEAQSEVDVEPDDTEIQAKSEEEQQRRTAAVDALSALEHHFASLRDRLYDEKITQINRELAQLSAPEPDHPELLRQFDCVNKHRDEKHQVEQTLLVYKIGALKRKSVAERSQTHSAYFQTIRDVRERHMERMSEHFYKIQRQRWKSTQVVPTYTIPFPEKRAVQVSQQTSYNKEVSVLSGVAKYVGFPAAPKLSETADAELNADLQRMGINSSASRLRKNNTIFTANNVQSTTATEQQFIESTPWANPNHPIHRLRPTKSPFDTPAAKPPPPQNSASTIVEDPTPDRISSMLQAGAAAQREYSSPLQARAFEPMRDTRSPFRADLVSAGGMGRFGFR